MAKTFVYNLEEDELLHTLLRYGLKHNDYKLKKIDSAEELWKYVRKQNKQLVLVDLTEKTPEEEVKKKIKLGRLTINVKKRTASVDGEKLQLTPTEFDILHYLWMRRDEVVSAKELLTHIWGWGQSQSNTIQSHVLNLRKKLGPEKNLIQTVRGFGYTLTLEASEAGIGS